MPKFIVFLVATIAFPQFSYAEDFKGYPCTVDCSGHEAGYEWAEDKGITDPDDCGGNSNSFIEGCQAYAEEQQDSPQEDSFGSSYDGGEDYAPDDY